MGLVDQKLTGRLKFKLFKIKIECEQAVNLLSQAMDGIDNHEEQAGILNEEEDIQIDKFIMDELEGLPLSMKDIGNLAPIIDFGEELEEEE